MKKRRHLTESEMRDIRMHARTYVNVQMETMRRYGSAPDLTEAEFDALVERCMKPAIEIAKWTPEPAARALEARPQP
jgi:hypothetical protein